MLETSPPPRTRSRLTLLAVAAAFVLPILIAAWMARSGGPGSGAQLVNHGTFIEPTLDITADAGLRAFEAVPLAPGEWAVVRVAGGACDAGCEADLDTLLTLRTLLGNDATRVRIVVIADTAPSPRSGLIELVDPATRAHLAAALLHLPGAQTDGSGVVFLDWRGQIMMYFADATAPADIKSDLKRLLRASRIK